MILNSELGLDKNRYDRRHRHTLREEKAQEVVGSMSRRIVGTLVIPHAGTSPHK